MFMKLLAPYGSLNYLPLSAKVGDVKATEPKSVAVLAPYGDLANLPLSTKVGSVKTEKPSD